MAIVCIETEVDGFGDDNPDDPFTCIILEGHVVEIAGEPIESIDMSTGLSPQMIEIKALDTKGVMRITPVDLEDLEPVPLC